MNFNELDEMSINIQKAENFLKNKCYFKWEEHFPETKITLIWNVETKRLLAEFGDPGEKKPLIEWKIIVRVLGFSYILPFIKSCMDNHNQKMKCLNLKTKISELEDYIYNQ